MTHSSLLRVISHLGIRASKKFLASNSPNPNWCQYSRRNRLILARPGACFSMGQASSSITGDSAIASQKPELLEAPETLIVSPEQALTSQLDSKLETILVSEGSNPESKGATIPEGSNPESKGATTPEGKEDSNSGGGKGGATTPENVKKETEEEAQRALKLEELGEPPERPLPGDCCGQGCDVCVWDTYNDELRDYLARRKALLKSPSNNRRSRSPSNRKSNK